MPVAFSTTEARPPRPAPLQGRSLRTRGALLRAAADSFDRDGYAATTARGIAERAGVGTGTFYHHFPDKDAALREITSVRVASLLERSVPRGALGPRARLAQLVDVYLEVHRADPGLHAVIAERRASDAAIAEVLERSEAEAVRRFEAALEEAGHPGDRRAVAFLMFALLEGAVHAHVLSRPLLEDRRLRGALVDALLALASPLPRRPASPGRSQEGTRR